LANKPGDFIWYELMTSDPEGAAAFYGPLVGWTFSSANQPGMDYRQFTAANGDMIGGCMKMPDGAPMPPMWLGYIGVDDVDQSATNIREAGGQIHMEPQDIPGVGRFAFVADPQGVPFYIMRGASGGTSNSFASETPKDGHCAWNELSTIDPSAAMAFYTGQFGWVQDGDMDMGPLGKYSFIRHGEQIGAIMPKMPDQPVPAWTYYFRVTDIDAAKSAAEASGGQIFHGPSEVPGGDFIINGMDPQGAMFALVGRRAS
jgi:predicted enzyme related to lactoylglutathione lyase